jgi:hypothetical protein
MAKTKIKIMDKANLKNESNAPAVAFLRKRDFVAELPEDFVQLISIENQYGHLPINSFMEQGRIDWIGRYKTEQFTIRENKIYFSGTFSRWWIIRLWQKFIEWLFPITYKMKYIDYERWQSHCR